ncbi:hypothetical protein DNTS_009217 [Danionella cerebrum]|uniref:SOGA 1/2-like coiled-coil domain-containing protein n=1 Tax=Danionella cerebrum TaxID=2873325 RepID=A0A553MMW5_9TELE|nr:hypothetical protein DNTS_009217 [Danionella translucida]
MKLESKDCVDKLEGNTGQLAKVVTSVTFLDFQLKGFTRMAALEMQRGLKPGSCVWGGERPDLLDSFDSEMQEWEDQLQDMQRKIEELYNEVKARREASDNNAMNIKSLDITLHPVNPAFGHCEHPNDLSIPQSKDNIDPHAGFHRSRNNHNGSNNSPLNSTSNGNHYPKRCHNHEAQESTLEILSGYFQQEESRGKILGSPAKLTGHPGKHGFPKSMKASPATNRDASCVEWDDQEDTENKKNKKSILDDSQTRRVTWKDPITSNDLPPKTSSSKLVIRQRDPSPVSPWVTFQDSSQQPDRKCLLTDKKTGSPSVVRKFGAMLQENEGKTLIEDGQGTTVVSSEQPKHSSAPPSQCRFDARRAVTRVPVQKCLTDSDAPMAELGPSQEHLTSVSSRNLLSGDRDSGRAGLEQHVLYYNLIPSESRLKSGYNKVAPGPGSTKEGLHDEDLFSDYQMMERILRAARKVHAGLAVDRVKQENDNLEQLLEMMEMENNRSQRVTFTQQTETKQVKCISSSPSAATNFSRPARPANQRRPSRWVRHNQLIQNTIAPCPPSPGLKAKSFLKSYSRHTETVIM